MLLYAKMPSTFTAYERGHLLLANSFECTQTEDRRSTIYYMSGNNWNFNQERDELHLTGALATKRH